MFETDSLVGLLICVEHVKLFVSNLKKLYQIISNNTELKEKNLNLKKSDLVRNATRRNAADNLFIRQ